MTGLPSVRRRGALLLVALAAVVVLERLHTYAEPMDRDVAGYAVIAHEMLRGRDLYADLWERKPPLLYGSFAVAERAVGYGPGEVFALNVLAALVTLAAAYAAGGPVAAALWAGLGADLFLQANQPNGEAFVNACLTTAFALAVRWPLRAAPRYARALAVGGLCAAATLYKQHVIVVALALAVAHLATAGRPRGRRWAEVAVAAAAVLVAWAAVLGYFAAVGRLGPMVDVLFRQNLDYAGDPFANLRAPLGPRLVWYRIVPWVPGPAVLVLARVLLVRGHTGPASRWVTWAAWAVGTTAAVGLPGHLFPHYWQLMVPPACVAGGWAADALLDRRARGRGPWLLRPAAVLAGLGAVLAREVPFYRLSPAQWAAAKDVGPIAQTGPLSVRLRALLRPGESFWNFGQDPTLYFATGQSPPTGLLYLDPLCPGPRAAGYWRQEMAGLNAARPDLVVLSRENYYFVGFDAPVFPWLRAHYVPVGIDPDAPAFLLMARRDSDLARRLARDPRGIVPLPPKP